MLQIYNKEEVLGRTTRLLSFLYIKPRERFCIPNYYLYRIDRLPGRKGSTAVAVRKGTLRTWSDTDITPLLKFRKKYILEVNLDAKHPFWNNTVPNSSGGGIYSNHSMQIVSISQRHNTQHSIQYSPAENGDMLDIVVHQNVRLSRQCQFTIDVMGLSIAENMHSLRETRLMSSDHKKKRS
jgi:hypothetical protein